MKRLLVLLLFGSVATAMHLPYVHEYVERKAQTQQQAHKLGNDLLKIFKDVEKKENAQIKPKSYTFPPDQLKIATDLIARGANVNIKDADANDMPILARAIAIGDPLVVKLLLEKGANVNGQDGRWALQAWLLYELTWPEYLSTQILKLLAEYGIHLDYSDLNPLSRAAYRGNLESVKLLLEGVPLQSKEKVLEEKFGKERTSYFSLLPQEIRKQVFYTALVNVKTNKANPNIKDRDGNTALYHAREGFRLIEKPMTILQPYYRGSASIYDAQKNAEKIKPFIAIINLLKQKMDPSLITYSPDGY